jgi:hypothetical protein
LRRLDVKFVSPRNLPYNNKIGWIEPFAVAILNSSLESFDPFFTMTERARRDLGSWCAAKPCLTAAFDYEPIRIESGRLDHSRTFFAHRIKSR